LSACSAAAGVVASCPAAATERAKDADGGKSEGDKGSKERQHHDRLERGSRIRIAEIETTAEPCWLHEIGLCA
jgi:hypothetical protein